MWVWIESTPRAATALPLCDTQTAERQQVAVSLGFGSGCCLSRHKPRWMNMSVCSETFLFQNLLWHVWREIAQDDLCTRLLSISSIYLDFFFFSLLFSFKGSPSRSSGGRMNVTLLLDVLCRSDTARRYMRDATSSWCTFSNIDYSHRCRRLSLKNDCLCSAGSQCHPTTKS